jgi:hypothetical protein
VSHHPRRPPRRPLATPALVAALAVLAACAPSPNRGTWRGDFSGSLSGVVEFRINARGKSLSGTIVGETRDGAPFEATMKGRIEGESFYATFEGKGRAAVYSVPFTGFMRGTLGGGVADGSWEAELRGRQGKLTGTWSVEQVVEDR